MFSSQGKKMEESFFTKFRKLASSLNDAEEEIRRKEKLDVDGSEHYALQQNAIERFRQAVSTTKANMKTLQPTVLVSHGQSWAYGKG
jgi:hypothetical protein